MEAKGPQRLKREQIAGNPSPRPIVRRAPRKIAFRISRNSGEVRCGDEGSEAAQPFQCINHPRGTTSLEKSSTHCKTKLLCVQFGLGTFLKMREISSRARLRSQGSATVLEIKRKLNSWRLTRTASSCTAHARALRTRSASVERDAFVRTGQSSSLCDEEVGSVGRESRESRK